MPRQAARRPPKCVIINLSTDEIKECQFNPTRFVRQHVVNYGRITVAGVGHQVMQFSNTTNRQSPSLAFVMDSLVSPFDIADFVSFIEALTVPPRGGEGTGRQRPPLALFVWPGVFSFEALVTSFQAVDERMAINGTPTRTTLTITLEEKRDLQKFSEDLRSARALTAADVEEAFDVEFEFG